MPRKLLWTALLLVPLAGCSTFPTMPWERGEFVIYEGEVALPADGSPREVKFPRTFGTPPEVVTFFDHGTVAVVDERCDACVLRLSQRQPGTPTTVRWLAKGFLPGAPAEVYREPGRVYEGPHVVEPR
jgi:hypothetical protein